jgi:putative ABC transport system substrate-binding protein
MTYAGVSGWNRLQTLFPCFVAALLALALLRAASANEDVKRLAFVSPVAASTVLSGEAEFWARLRERGWVEGRNITYAKYFADGDRARLPALMQQALRGGPHVIVTPGTPAALEAKRATTAVPIVGLMGDPIGAGLVASLSRPGGNLTGISVQNTEEVPAKWIELLRELRPGISRFAVAVHPEHPLADAVTAQLGRAAAQVGATVIRFDAYRPEDFGRIVEQARRRAQALIVQPSDLAIHSRSLIAEAAAKHRMPVLYALSDFVDAGGLISYGSDLGALWRRLGDYADKILKGANPADLPVEQPVTFDLVINLKAAKAIGISVPQSLLQRADRVVE